MAYSVFPLKTAGNIKEPQRFQKYHWTSALAIGSIGLSRSSFLSGMPPLIAPATFYCSLLLLPPTAANLLIASALLGENTFSVASCQGSQA
jgi:hypothetical protein